MSDTVTCARCYTENPPTAERCLSCRSFLARNQVARRTGIYARNQPPELKADIEQFLAGIVADRGGESELSTLEHSYVEKLGDIDVTIRLLTHDIATNGLLTPGGRVREVYDKLLAGLAAFDRYAQRIGIERRAKRVESIEEIMREHDTP